HDHPKILPMPKVLENQPDEPKDQRQHEQPVIGLIVNMDAVRHLALIAKPGVVEKGYPGDPVAVTHIAEPFQVVLLSGIAPEEIADEHPVSLVIPKILQVV